MLGVTASPSSVTSAGSEGIGPGVPPTGTDAFWRALLAHAVDVTWTAAEDGTLEWATSALPRQLGWTLEQVAGRSLFDLVHPEEVDPVRADWRAVVEGGARQLCREIRVQHADGSYRLLRTTVTDLREEPAVGRLVGNSVDVTEQRRTEAARAADLARLREVELRREQQEQFFLALAARASDLALVADADGRLLFVSPAARGVLGYEPEDVLACDGVDFVHPDDVTAVRAAVAAVVAQGGSRTFRCRVRAADGSWRWMEETVTNLLATPIGGVVANLRDVTAEVQAEDELRRAALHDALTGLPNRALLLDRLQHALARESVATAVMFVDLDQLKLVNDGSGHATGDELLVAVAERLRAGTRPGDTVARFGGDEFVVVCEDADAEQALLLAEDLAARLAEPYPLADRLVTVTASIGVATSPGDAGELLRWADTAMYAAKAAGRRCVRLFERAMSDEAERRFTVARELRLALDADELSLHYQPVVDLESGRVLGVEALARWDSPRLGPVPPNTFVPVAEQTGLVGEVDAFTVRRALRDVAELRASGALPADAYVAVNLSARSLGDGSVEPTLRAAVAATGLCPQDVVLEITETAVVEDARSASDVLGRLRAQGFSVAVDDFGTGYSSLAYLRQLPVTALKIDRTFVAGLDGDDPDALAIVASIVDLSRAVGLDVVAEGVETVGQAAVLRRLGCKAGQGWLWSRAVPLDRARVADWTAGFGLGTRRRTPSSAAPAQEHGLSRLLALHREGASLTTIAAALNREGYRRPDGTRWHRASVARAVAQSAYPQLVGG
jgi:diguanylate cyclase (GGDEF)-like protein/PAS domain S-box-containing protein